MAGTDAHLAQSLFYADLPVAEANAVTARLTAQSVRVYHDTVTSTAWRGRPTTYVVTEQDTIFPVAAQEALAARAGSTGVRMATSHSPFLSQPAVVTDIIERAAGHEPPSGE
jgi:pimeloyl-ACP methyl ester carboxylesterase